MKFLLLYFITILKIIFLATQTKLDKQKNEIFNSKIDFTKVINGDKNKRSHHKYDKYLYNFIKKKQR